MSNEKVIIYKRRKDVHLVKICDTYLLIPEKSARGDCKFARRINDTAAFFWELLEDGISIEELTEEAKKHYDAPDNLLYEDISRLIGILKEKTYIIEIDE